MGVYFVLQLDENGSPAGKKKFARLPPPRTESPYTVHFILTAGTKATRKARLLTNYPVDGGSFERNTFHSIEFKGDAFSDLKCNLQIKQPGVFEYKVEYTDWTTEDRVTAPGGTLLVDPRLYLPETNILDPAYNSKNAKSLLPLDAISIITVIPKWMPTLSHWLPFFQSFSSTGYNMVHFAPVNERGISDSPYSIYDQLSISADLYDEKKLSCSERITQFGNMIHQIQETCSMLSITDVVWNHTACNSEWLHEHPEAGYNLKNSPHLRPAYELDSAILDFSESLAKDYHQDPNIKTDGQLQVVMDIFNGTVLPSLKLWEFYVIDVQSVSHRFAQDWNIMDDNDPIPDHHPYNKINLGFMSLKDRAALLAEDALYITDEGTRFAKTLNTPVAVAFIHKYLHDTHKDFSLKAAVQAFEEVVNEINLDFYKEYDGDVEAIKSQVYNRARYLRVADHGPRLGPVSKKDPLVDSYFTRLPINAKTSLHHPDELMLANNGWIWNADPLVNFASKKSKAYLRREVIAWGDCVKLRYGDKPEDSPWLWEHQTKYTEMMAELFHGFRIDNCHSTPIHVAEYLLDKARKINPDLYVFAELFTGSEEKDVIFVSRLGINSLIREAMSAWDPSELSRQVHRYGGYPVGSFTTSSDQFPPDLLGHLMSPCFYEPFQEDQIIFVDLKGSNPHALFMDCTHDNETPNQRRTAEDTLPNAAIVAMSNCAIGSVKGYDEIVPELLNVVTETRKYRVPEPIEGIIPAKTTLYGIHSRMAKKGYSEIHVHQENDFISIHRVHPMTHDGYLLVARTAFRATSHPGGHQPIILRNQRVQMVESASLKVQTSPRFGMASPYLSPEMEEEKLSEELNPPQSPTLFYHPFDSTIERKKNGKFHRKKILGCISGLPCSLTVSHSLTTLCTVKEENPQNGDFQTVINVEPENFTPGSFVIYRTWMVDSDVEDTEDLESIGGSISGLSISLPVTPSPQLGPNLGVAHLWELLGFEDRKYGLQIMSHMGLDSLHSSMLWFTALSWPPGLSEAVSGLGIQELNVALYRSEAEERDVIDDGLYDVPNFGKLAYGGLQGFVTPLLSIARSNDLGNSFCGNLRAGFWMIDYVIGRLEKYGNYYQRLFPFTKWLKERLELVKTVAPAFVPKYFATVVILAYQGLRYRSLELSSVDIKPFASSMEIFDESCRMTSIQVLGGVKSTGLFPRDYPLNTHALETSPHAINYIRPGSMAAGLPHFSTFHMRCWGRDTFIALRGLLLIPGHFDKARRHIIAFGSTLRHGLIPNLLDQGIKPRYNARDATWWWLLAVSEYCKMSPEGIDFLGALVARRFVPLKRYIHGPSFGQSNPDDKEHIMADNYIAPDDPLVYTFQNTVAELCFEILERHARGIAFREWNAGPDLDHAMSSEGFNINIFTDWQKGTGFVCGGSKSNCGTWMDKMGDSIKAGTRGVPATPRDGADIEIIGLQKSFLRWISDSLIPRNVIHWKWDGVHVLDKKKGGETLVTFQEWDKMIQQSFEKHFFIPKSMSDDEKYAADSGLVNRRGIYKDTFGSELKFGDYQLRPNVCVAMTVAPELFNLDNMESALEMIKDTLLGPLGIKTLDPADWAYRGNYDNSNDSNDATVAHGFNYHQGPEWLWLCCYFYRAFLTVSRLKRGPASCFEAVQQIQKWILFHKKYIQENQFAGLPELTNQNGAMCHGSCPTQAWSTAVMIEVIHDLKQLC